MSAPDITQQELDAVSRVLSSGTLSLGPQQKCFEQQFAGYLDLPYAAGVSSGTSALHLCMIAAGVDENSLAITSPFSFIASANSILYQGATPIFVDVDPITGNLDPELSAECARDLQVGGSAAANWLPPKPQKSEQALKALLPVHAFGQPAALHPLLGIARQYGLSLIEDACEALGAEYSGRKVGSFGDAAVFAFYANKQMTMGEGGVIATARADWDALFRSLRNQGRDGTENGSNHARLGYNYRLDEMSAALGVVQLNRIEELLSKRARVAAWYTERLERIPQIELPRLAAETTRMSWFVYVIRLRDAAQRATVSHYLAARGVPSRVYFSPIHLQSFYVEKFGYRRGMFPVTERLGEICLALPFSSVMSEAQVDFVCRCLVEALASD